MPAARARTVMATYEMQNVTWAIESWPKEPVLSNSWRKNSSSERPMTISGVTIGSRRSSSAGAAAADREPGQAQPERRANDRGGERPPPPRPGRSTHECVEELVVREAAGRTTQS